MIIRPRPLLDRMILPDDPFLPKRLRRPSFLLNSGYPAGSSLEWLVLLHNDGTNGSTTIVNSGTGPSFTVQTAGSLNTTAPKFGTASYDSSGTNGYLKGGASITLDGQFSIAVWLDPDNFNGCLCSIGNPSSVNGTLAINRFNDAFYVQERVGGTTTTIVEANVSWNNSDYNHCLLERDGSGVMHLVFAGTEVDSATVTTTYTGIPSFGDYEPGGVWNQKGKYDECIIVKGGRVHGSYPFSVPTGPYSP